jgi:hypothetical protein
MSAEFRAQIVRILDQHAEALRALRTTHDQVHRATRTLNELIATQDAIFQVTNDAIAAALDANQAALALLRQSEDDQ